ncbi:reverse transcriptase domain-containing protein [Tanacetum coccineum]|uniref:Reverse transcriptase domain-containing protein n=1 Tax=Tanacetum coccineum TaxID=301880 RepID=A0ABQ5FX92_9ASTR
MVKKHDDSWQMCVDFTDLNKACPQDCYPLLEINWKVESLCGYPFKCFLDAYKGYHQIQMVESDEEKTAFHTSQGVYCYTKMPFGLKNVGATYQRLVDKAFDSQVGQNIKVYVDDLVIKSHTEAEMLRDIDETFTVLQLPSPQTIKEVQSLNGKLASLNRFLSKSAEKSLPLFKTLKKCIKKSDLHWTPDAEQAFKQLKQHLSELPLLVAPKPKEKLIVYLSATHGAISAVLMTERGTVQTPVYFVSRVLQGLELNYTPMEKLVLLLVFAAKTLRSVMLGEHNITYRPRTSVKGQILADFLVEKPDESPSDTSVVETPQNPWTLFTDGSSCAEYEALIAGLRIAAQIGVRNVHVSVDSKLVANQVLGAYVDKEENMIKYLEKVKSLVLVEILKEKSIQEKEVTTVVEEDGPTWMTPIIEYLKEGTLLDDKKEASKLSGPFSEGPVKVKKFVWDNIVCRFNLPGEIVSENGKQFSDNPFKDWCKKLNITQRFALVKHPQSNGLVERANRILGEGIKARLGEGNKNWIEELPHVLWAHRTMIKSSHGDTPFSLTYGMEAVIPAEIGMPTYCTAVVDAVHNNEELRLNLDLLEERRECAAIREAKAKLKMTKYYNARVRGVTFRPEDFVYRSNNASHAVDGGKLGQKWEGPYEVTEALGDGAYKSKSIDGTVLPRTWNIANLKKCYL